MTTENYEKHKKAVLNHMSYYTGGKLDSSVSMDLYHDALIGYLTNKKSDDNYTLDSVGIQTFIRTSVRWQYYREFIKRSHKSVYRDKFKVEPIDNYLDSDDDSPSKEHKLGFYTFDVEIGGLKNIDYEQLIELVKSKAEIPGRAGRHFKVLAMYLDGVSTQEITRRFNYSDIGSASRSINMAIDKLKKELNV
jgi:hypothetical protein